MRVSRIHLPIGRAQLQQMPVIEGDRAHYLRNVLRLKPGHALRVFIDDGSEFLTCIERVDKHSVHLRIEQEMQPVPQSALNVRLLQGISATDRMDYAIQKATELGVARITPVLTEHASTRIAPHKREKKALHWRAVAVAAAEQCGRVDVPVIDDIMELHEALQSIDWGVYLHMHAEATIATFEWPATRQLSVLIGPEGGFSTQELNAFAEMGLTGIRLGQRTLRTETVAPVVLAALHALHGDFRQ